MVILIGIRDACLSRLPLRKASILILLMATLGASSFSVVDGSVFGTLPKALPPFLQ